MALYDFHYHLKLYAMKTKTYTQITHTYDDEALCTAAPELRGLPSGTTMPMEVFPNPARGRAVVNSGWAEAESARLTVYNSLGVPVLQTELPLFGGQGEVDLSQLPSGWYSLLLQAEGERKVARLVIAR